MPKECDNCPFREFCIGTKRAALESVKYKHSVKNTLFRFCPIRALIFEEVNKMAAGMDEACEVLDSEWREYHEEDTVGIQTPSNEKTT